MFGPNGELPAVRSRFFELGKAGEHGRVADIRAKGGAKRNLHMLGMTVKKPPVVEAAGGFSH